MFSTTTDIFELEQLARDDPTMFRKLPIQECVKVAREHLLKERKRIFDRHKAGESGSTTLRLWTGLCDDIVRVAFQFALARILNGERVERHTVICALGGYGRGEMSPCSDLDISLIVDVPLDQDVENLNAFLVPFFWDIGFKVGYALHTVADATALAVSDPQVFTSYAQGRRICGDSTTFARLKMMVLDQGAANRDKILAYVRQRERSDALPAPYRDLYALEPDIKENCGGLRDFHAGSWMILLTHGIMRLDDLVAFGLLDTIEHLELVSGLDFVWRIRNELHFHTQRAENVLTLPLQHHVATTFGYGDSSRSIARFMEDYYNAACKIRHFLHIAVRICDQPIMAQLFDNPTSGQSNKYTVYQHQLCIDPSDKNWFMEYPPRLMEVIWQCARRATPLSLASAHWLKTNLHLVNEEFRESDAVRRFFLAVCARPQRAGLALREAAKTGLLGAYLPEFKAVTGIVRYEDFHSYPVDEHTLRALEALAHLSDPSVALSPVLYRVFERIQDPHVLVLAILFHDLGKVVGDNHVEASVTIAQNIMKRTGIQPYDAERVLFLVRHHMLMSTIAFYRDTDDLGVVAAFANTIKTDDLLQMLLLLTYADLMAVAPNVWNEWKGALLVKLFLKAQRILTGRAEGEFDLAVIQPKLDEVRVLAEKEQLPDIEGYLSTLTERYILGYSPVQIVTHIKCLYEAYYAGLAVRCTHQPELGGSEVVICTRDRHGLFAQIAGAFTSQLINVRNAALFTRDDGWVVDSFLVDNATTERPLTENEVEALKRVLVDVILEQGNIQEYVDKSRNKLFALSRPSVVIKPTVLFDNTASPRDTVIDIVAADRTGLLYDIAHTLSEMGIDFRAAHIVTDVGRARDAFYVQMNGAKIQEEKLKEWIARRLFKAIAGPESLKKT